MDKTAYKDGTRVSAIRPGSDEYDRAPRRITGELYTRWVNVGGGYRQYFVNGFQVDKDSIEVLDSAEEETVLEELIDEAANPATAARSVGEKWQVGKFWYTKRPDGRVVRTADPSKAAKPGRAKKSPDDVAAAKQAKIDTAAKTKATKDAAKADKIKARDDKILAKEKASREAAQAKVRARQEAHTLVLKASGGGSLTSEEVKTLSGHLANLTVPEIRDIQKAFSKNGGRVKAERIQRVMAWASSKESNDGSRSDERSDGGASQAVPGESPEASGPVEITSGGTASKSPDQSGENEDKPTRPKTADRVPAQIDKVNRDIDRFGAFFQAKGQHEVAGFLAALKNHVNAVGVESALESLGTQGGRGDGDESQYKSASGTSEQYMGHFCEAYLARNGITAVTSEENEDIRTVSSIASSTGPKDPYIDGSFTPVDPTFKNKLDEAKHLPGLGTSEDISKIVGHPVTHLTPEVMAKMDERYGNGKWIIKAYGDDAYAGYGIFFPQRSEQIAQDARNTIWSAGEHVAKHGFEIARDKEGRIVGLKHEGGDTYDFGSKKYDSTIHGDVRHWGDLAAAAAKSEHGAELPGGGKEFMAQPAFAAVGVSDADRAAGKTIAPGEGRVHIVTKNGKATIVPHGTWIKGEHLPVVFESPETKAMAQAALDSINHLPESERKGQIYAPDIIKAEGGYKVVEANPTTETGGGSGYLEDNPFIIDSYVSHLTGREPAHVRFIRQLLTKRKSA
jgi:hypothetical protein